MEKMELTLIRNPIKPRLYFPYNNSNPIEKVNLSTHIPLINLPEKQLNNTILLLIIQYTPRPQPFTLFNKSLNKKPTDNNSKLCNFEILQTSYKI
jgi:hypothetical protein